MAKGQHLSNHQQKIVKRYYQNLDTISLDKLAQLVSDISVCDDPKKLDKLWERVRLALDKVDGNKVAVEKVLQTRDVKGLAALLNGLM